MPNSEVDYNQILEELRQGEREEFVLQAKDFPQFFETWRDYPYQNAIVGEAHHGGEVVYRKRPESEM
ncbi:hypothetical protein JOC36_001591 [Weissella uvarum]|uniref:hypothetical protein n=1 Tax=Weissella uvarum TaxID=1479233 RepID=UPI001960CF3E|nr:hypothetical protein [Weissella uvarum]MBM7617997.1 hypothetical protein [Weissella uvarum]MCM0596216.1 hypothetical protein [Weissella uvarum]